jgi:hypothetical protein
MPDVSAGEPRRGPRWKVEEMRGRSELPLSICVILVNAAMAETREADPPRTPGGRSVPTQAQSDRGIKA